MTYLEQGNDNTMYGVQLAAMQITWGIAQFLLDELWNRERHILGCSGRWVLGALIYDKQLRLTPSTSKQFSVDQTNAVLQRQIH